MAAMGIQHLPGPGRGGLMPGIIAGALRQVGGKAYGGDAACF